MGGRPSKGTRRDRRLKVNKKSGGMSGKPRRGKPFGKGNSGDGQFPI